MTDLDLHAGFSHASSHENDVSEMVQGGLNGCVPESNFGGAISWNFNKFLIGRDGVIVRRFGSRTKPDDKELIAAVEQALRAPM